MGVLPSYKPMTSAGSVQSESANVLQSDRTNAGTPGIDGSGVKVGILSDSYNNQGTAAADVASGDLPPNVTVLQDDPYGGGTDEGRAMLQIVHDVAPGATLGFATAEGSAGDLSFAQNIKNLANPSMFGANIIADDVFYEDEPYFQEGPIGQAIDQVTSQGVTYFAAAGNLGTQAYESTNVSFMNDTIASISATASSFYNFNPGGVATDKQQITLSAGQEAILGLQWAQPFYTTNGVKTNLNFYVLDDTTGAVVMSGTTNAVTAMTPMQLLEFTNNTGTAHTYDVVIQNANGGPVPSALKYVNFGSNDYGDITFDDFATNSPTITPHAADTNAMAVAAAPFFDQHTPESYSSMGPATFLFTANGTALKVPQVVNKPDIMSIDGVSTTFFGSPDYINGYPNFFGTSAATPAAAGVAALVKEANPGFTPAKIDARLESTADPNVSDDSTTGDFNVTPGNADIVGAGLVNAYQAVFGAPVAATPNFTDNFASGALGQGWQIYDAGAGRTQVTTANNPPAGDTYDLTMDGSADGYGFPTLNEAILNVNAANYTNLTLSFKDKSIDTYDDPMSPLPAGVFTGHVDGDGVSISVDGGKNWYPLLNLNTDTNNVYQSHNNINLSAFAASHGLTLGNDVQIKFQQYDPNSFEYNSLTGLQEGFVFDDVSVTGRTKPTITLNPSNQNGVGGSDGDVHGSGQRQSGADGAVVRQHQRRHRLQRHHRQPQRHHDHADAEQRHHRHERLPVRGRLHQRHRQRHHDGRHPHGQLRPGRAGGDRQPRRRDGDGGADGDVRGGGQRHAGADGAVASQHQ